LAYYPSSHGQTTEEKVHVEEEDMPSEGCRGAVWGSKEERSAGLKMLESASILSPTEEEADGLTEFVTCDGCGLVVQGALWVCQSCFGFDICGACHDVGCIAVEHTKASGPDHIFFRER